MTHTLTPKQARVLLAIQAHVAMHKSAPTITDLCMLTATKSRGSMHDVLRQLERKKMIRRGPGHRNLQLLPAAGACPHCGHIKDQKRKNGGYDEPAQIVTERVSTISPGPLKFVISDD